MRKKKNGFVVSIELLFILVFVIMGVVVGWSSLKDAVVNELVDTASAIDELNQSYSFFGATSHSGSVSGSVYADNIDFCQNGSGFFGAPGYDPFGAVGRCVELLQPPATEGT